MNTTTVEVANLLSSILEETTYQDVGFALTDNKQNKNLTTEQMELVVALSNAMGDDCGE